MERHRTSTNGASVAPDSQSDRAGRPAEPPARVAGARNPGPIEIRDPIHGAVALSPAEAAIADEPFVQRLRQVRQTGFSQIAFPGATHSRFAHAIGVMHLAGVAFDRAYADFVFDKPDARARFRFAVRIAALCHDLGHPPFSHCAEFALPQLEALGLYWLRPEKRRATHEDYTVAILEKSSLRDAIGRHCPFDARHVASLVRPEVRPGDDFFQDGGLDHRRALSQLVSSELDVDRLDYLVRDATFTGARYGQVDVNWLVGNLTTWVAHGQVHLALDARAIYAFDHFLLARHHMFLMVYFHHKSVVYEEMLKRWVEASGLVLPSDLDAYLLADDIWLLGKLRESGDRWARRIVQQHPFQRVWERHGAEGRAEQPALLQRLADAGVEAIAATSTGTLSRYSGTGSKRKQAASIYVVDRLPGPERERVVPLARASQVFERYAEERTIDRIYVAPEDLDRATAALGA